MSDVDIRMKQFRSLMEPALHIFPPYLIRDLEANGFFTAPASTKYHGAFEGGLFEHSRNVTQVLITLTHDNGLAWQRPESPHIIGAWHGSVRSRPTSLGCSTTCARWTSTGILCRMQSCTHGMQMGKKTSERSIRQNGSTIPILCSKVTETSP